MSDLIHFSGLSFGLGATYTKYEPVKNTSDNETTTTTSSSSNSGLDSFVSSNTGGSSLLNNPAIANSFAVVPVTTLDTTNTSTSASTKTSTPLSPIILTPIAISTSITTSTVTTVTVTAVPSITVASNVKAATAEFSSTYYKLQQIMDEIHQHYQHYQDTKSFDINNGSGSTYMQELNSYGSSLLSAFTGSTSVITLDNGTKVSKSELQSSLNQYLSITENLIAGYNEQDGGQGLGGSIQGYITASYATASSMALTMSLFNDICLTGDYASNSASGSSGSNSSASESYSSNSPTYTAKDADGNALSVKTNSDGTYTATTADGNTSYTGNIDSSGNFTGNVTVTTLNSAGDVVKISGTINNATGELTGAATSSVNGTLISGTLDSSGKFTGDVSVTNSSGTYSGTATTDAEGNNTISYTQPSSVPQGSDSSGNFKNDLTAAINAKISSGTDNLDTSSNIDIKKLTVDLSTDNIKNLSNDLTSDSSWYSNSWVQQGVDWLEKNVYDGSILQKLYQTYQGSDLETAVTILGLATSPALSLVQIVTKALINYGTDTTNSSSFSDCLQREFESTVSSVGRIFNASTYTSSSVTSGVNAATNAVGLSEDSLDTANVASVSANSDGSRTYSFISGGSATYKDGVAASYTIQNETLGTVIVTPNYSDSSKTTYAVGGVEYTRAQYLQMTNPLTDV